MHTLVRSVIVVLGAVCGTVAAAQVADRDTSPVNAGLRSSVTAPPASTVHTSGSAKAILVPFGPFITQSGVGSGGAAVSELYGLVGYSILGYGMQGSLNTHVADEFVVPVSQQWSVASVKWLVYQTGSSTAGTITSMNLNLWDTDPTGQLPGGQATTGGNQFQSQTWTGVYRVVDSGVVLNTRPIIQVTCSGLWIPSLSSGTYWIEASGGGTLASGPWAPPKTKPGQVPPTGDPWNGLQSVSGGAFAQVFDTGNPAGSINEPADFLWQVEGTGGSSCACGWCSPAKTSSLGCTPTMSTNSVTANKSGAGTTQFTATPVPGGPNLTGILIYSKNAPVPPVSTAFGSLCLSAFARAGAFSTTPGGSPGTCSGAYVWNVTAIVSGTASILVGDQLYFQGWYRDPGFPPPGNANFTNGIGPIAVIP